MALNPAQFAGYESYEEALQGYANALSAPVPFKEWVVFANAVGRLYEDSPRRGRRRGVGDFIRTSVT